MRYSKYFLAYAILKPNSSGVTAAQLTASVTAEEPPAVQAALATLSWPALCEFVARFASTTMGRQAVQRLPLSQDQEHSEALVKETSAVDKLESEYAVELDFGGTSTSQVLIALNGRREGRAGGVGRGDAVGKWNVWGVCHVCCVKKKMYLMHASEGTHNTTLSM